MKFAYQAYDNSGQSVTNTVEAADNVEADEQLHCRGLYVTQLHPVGETNKPQKRSSGSTMGKLHRLKRLAHFTRQFYILIATGTPIIDTLDALEQQANDTNWRFVIGRLRVRVEEGSSLSEAMKEHPAYFDPVYCSLITAGESAGKLTPILDQLSSLTRKQVNIQSNVLGALMYPLVLTVISASVIILLLTFVVPRFTEMFVMMNAPLPATTKMVVVLGDALATYWWAFATVIAGTTIGFIFWMGTDMGRRARDTALLRMPLIGALVRSLSTARIARFLGILLDSHLPLLDALNLLRQSMSNIHYAGLINKAEDAVVRGEPISTAFSDQRLISPAVYQAMRSGENSGRIAPSLIQIADFMDEENDVLVRSIGSIIEPVILVGLGLIVGLVALSMFTPLFDLAHASGGPA